MRSPYREPRAGVGGGRQRRQGRQGLRARTGEGAPAPRPFSGMQQQVRPGAGPRGAVQTAVSIVSPPGTRRCLGTGGSCSCSGSAAAAWEKGKAGR